MVSGAIEAMVIAGERTFILANILERKGQSCVFPLHNAHLAKCTLPYDSEELEVVQVDCKGGA
jgi:hypothetical protein